MVRSVQKERLLLKLTEEEKARLSVMAAQAKTTMTEMVRRRVFAPAESDDAVPMLPRHWDRIASLIDSACLSYATATNADERVARLVRHKERIRLLLNIAETRPEETADDLQAYAMWFDRFERLVLDERARDINVSVQNCWRALQRAMATDDPDAVITADMELAARSLAGVLSYVSAIADACERDGIICTGCGRHFPDSEIGAHVAGCAEHPLGKRVRDAEAGLAIYEQALAECGIRICRDDDPPTWVLEHEGDAVGFNSIAEILDIARRVAKTRAEVSGMFSTPDAPTQVDGPTDTQRLQMRALMRRLAFAFGGMHSDEQTNAGADRAADRAWRIVDGDPHEDDVSAARELAAISTETNHA